MASNAAFSRRELTELLHQNGALPQGSVTNVRVDLQVDTLFSHLTFVKLKYSANASSGLPKQLLIKRSLSGVTQSELEFYARFAAELSSPPLLPWYLTTSNGALLLQDLRPTHWTASWPDLPSDQICLQTVTTLAQVHAQWWENPDLGVTIGAPHSTESLSTMVAGIAASLPGFCDAATALLSKEKLRLLERVFSSSLKPWLRLTNPQALTVVHGDAHIWNFLLPRAEGGPVYLIDWQLWHVDVGVRDLAFLMAAHWDGEQRDRLEIRLLHRYHEELLARQVSNYSRDDLWLDYRLCAIRNLTIPILLWKRGVNDEMWQARLSSVLTAYDDLDCEELL